MSKACPSCISSNCPGIDKCQCKACKGNRIRLAKTSKPILSPTKAVKVRSKNISKTPAPVPLDEFTSLTPREKISKCLGLAAILKDEIPIVRNKLDSYLSNIISELCVGDPKEQGNRLLADSLYINPEVAKLMLEHPECNSKVVAQYLNADDGFTSRDRPWLIIIEDKDLLSRYKDDLFEHTLYANEPEACKQILERHDLTQAQISKLASSRYWEMRAVAIECSNLSPEVHSMLINDREFKVWERATKKLADKTDYSLIKDELVDGDIYKVSFLKGSTGTSDYESSTYRESVKVKNFFGRICSSISFNVTGKRLNVGLAETNAFYQRKGLATQTFKQMVKDNPEIESIHSDLGMDNVDVIEAHLKSQGTDLRAASPKQLMRATMSSPAFKIRKEVGFGKIISIEKNGRLVTVIVGRG